ncbi:Membrane protein insertase YidC [Saliniradius amylolyticus]|uniref:Membrane protein insertase YidC n=1 Tax=Saliniradius amylolyticus TaxID=2183582 RepID=A0A2S2E765_9ALTE|nr:membrane protein insertase YidC [Saliniradius amylolyticus]AWL13459.1 Membrane protein insertase YidC [Saliniradius amylolyticus]
MESQRSFLLIGLALVSFLLWQQWQQDYGPKPVQSNDTSAAAPSAQNAGNNDVPEGQQSEPNVPATASTGQQIHVLTDGLDVIIDTRGGDIVSARLPDYPAEQGSDEPFTLLNNKPNSLYVAQSGLIGRHGPDARQQEGRPVYSSEQTEYQLEGDRLTVPLVWENDQMRVTKAFVFKAGEHSVEVQYQIQNKSDQTQQFQQYGQLKRTMQQPEGSMFMPTYRGAAFSTKEDRYEKYDFDEITDDNLKKTTEGGWVGMLQHYFVSAWIPPQEQRNHLYSRHLSGDFAAIGFTGNTVTVPAGESAVLNATLYTGPKDQDDLAKLAEGLDLTVDYGFLWWLSQPLFTLLKWIHSLVGNWGLAIVAITVLVKGLMYPLTKAQYESMAKLRALQPKMAQLKERYGDDRQKMSQAMMEMYKKEKVNPMGGCFPLLLQMPIFLALYWVLLESVELRHADFILWITDLSVKDPYFVLPILTGATMYLIQKLQPMTIQDPMQQKIMQFMPVAMSVFFLWFPAGLVLYWFISNVITLIQAKMIYASMEKRGIKAK